MVGFSFVLHTLGFSRNSRFSKFSRISRKRTFLKRLLFQKTPFSEPDVINLDTTVASKMLRAPLHSRTFPATRRRVLSIHIFTGQSRANASHIQETVAEYCFEREYCFGEENSLSLTEFTANSVSSAKNSVSSLWHTHT